MDLQFFIFIWRRHFKTARYKAYIKEWKAIELNPKVRLTCIVYYLFFPQLDTYFLMFFLQPVLILGRGPCSWRFGLCFRAAWQSWHGRAPPLLERSLLVLLRCLPALETDGFGDDHVGPPSFILRLMGWQIFVEVWDSHITEVVSAGRDIILLWQYDMNVDGVECEPPGVLELVTRGEVWQWLVPGASHSGREPSPGAVPAPQIYRRVTCHVSRVTCHVSRLTWGRCRSAQSTTACRTRGGGWPRSSSSSPRRTWAWEIL